VTKTKGFFFPGDIENWWDPQTEQQFLEKAQCIINQAIRKKD
jgi:hypothetical protein